MTAPALPPLALSVRQPWAWAIVHGGKDIENRLWMEDFAPQRAWLRQRGRVAIHAAKTIGRDEYERAADFMKLVADVKCPAMADLARGGIIGSVEVVDVVRKSQSPWFYGPRGLVLKDPLPCSFVPAQGALVYFRRTALDNRSLLVMIESPYAGDVAANVKYARACVRDSLARGEAPFASHVFYTGEGILDDDIPEERTRGIEAGLAWATRADATVVYMDLGISPGMELGIAHAGLCGRRIIYRKLSKYHFLPSHCCTLLRPIVAK